MKWREVGPYLKELWHRPAGPINWKNPIRVFAVLGWLVVQGFVLLGWAGWRVFQGLMLLGWTVWACYGRRSRSRARFGGLREKILARDHHRCRVCGAREWLVVHHRHPRHTYDSLITLCAVCHARLHRLGAIHRWVPEPLLELWAEQHPGAPRDARPGRDVAGAARGPGARRIGERALPPRLPPGAGGVF